MKRPAVFVDRDGTINEQMGYVNHISRFVLLPGTAEAVRLLNRNDYLVIVISNQSGVARGYFPIELVRTVHGHMSQLLQKEDARIDAIFFCPHHPKGSVPEFRMTCECRKPRAGLVRQACKRFDIDLDNSYVVGDRSTDIELAHRIRVKGILVKTGYGLGEIDHVLPFISHRPAHIAEDLLDATRWIIGKERPRP